MVMDAVHVQRLPRTQEPTNKGPFPACASRRGMSVNHHCTRPKV